MAKGFVEALRLHSREVQQLEGAQADEFLRLLKATQEVIAGRYAQFVNDSQSLDGFRLKALLGEAEAAIATLEHKAVAKYDKAAQESVELAVDHIGDELDRLSLAFDARPLDVSIDAQAVLADPAQGLLANHYETSVARYGGELLNGVRQRLFIGLRTGDSVAGVAKSIAGAQGPFGAVGRASADRLVRTEVSQAYNSAHAASIKQAKEVVPGIVETWLHIGSYRCPTCAPLHATERPKSGYWTVRIGKKDRKVAHPPAHPSCVCRLTALKPSWRKGLQRLGYLEGQDDEERPSL